MGIAETYLNTVYKPDQLEDISNKNWTYDINMHRDGIITTVEVKDRTIKEDYIYEADDILIELIQEYRYYKEGDIGKRGFPNFNIEPKKFNSSLGWFYTEICEKLIYVKHVNTTNYIGKVVYDIDFIKFKSYYITYLLPLIDSGKVKYQIQRNTTQESSNSESINICIPITDFPQECWKKIDYVKEK